MSLSTYKKKRDFSKSPEPQGGKGQALSLSFVVQKHKASHLHYDFRLEMENVLKSWAVPKGPSMNPAIKHLAMMVEDHPFNYRDFEGIIPSGYGAGTVIVWDAGSYQLKTSENLSKKEMEQELLKGLAAGKLHIILQGKKLKGEFALVKTKNRGENAWLLFKIKDAYASTNEILEKDKSVKSGKTLQQIEKQNAMSPEKKPRKKAAKKVTRKNNLQAPFIPPMLATLTDEVFDSEDWVYEVKWDGYRALAQINGEEVALWSRNEKSFSDKFYPIVSALQEQDLNAVLDGEVVVLNENGISDFGALQNWRSEADGQLVFYVFDILWLNGKDLCQLPLTERQIVLKKNLLTKDPIRLSENFDTPATEFMKVARDLDLEGIIAKQKNSVYLPGQRTKYWLKMKTGKRQEVVIGGYTINEGTGKAFSALLVGVYEGNNFIYTGKVGTGFNTAVQKDLLKKFQKLRRQKNPFSILPDVNSPSRFRPNPPNAKVFWLKPKLIAEVNYTELTSEGIMRHPSFKGLREDKEPQEVILEKASPVNKKKASKKTKQAKDKLLKRVKEERGTLLNPTEKTQVKTLQGHTLTFNNLNKIYWPDEKITKREVLNYYYQAAPFILPYLSDRPQSMNRHPNGIQGKSFYQKDVTGKAPDWVETMLYRSEGDKTDKHFLICDGEASLLYMASMGCIELNPWHSRRARPDYPDWCVIDLDPGSNTNFNEVIKTAQVTHEILKQLRVPSFCKTSGSTGLHIYIPLGAKYTYEQSKEFARVIVTLVHEQLPEFTSIERMVRDRRGKMYLDFLQNRPQATIAAPYSLRPKPGATVSMPLHWEEVKKGLKMTDFTIKNAIARMRENGDLFRPVLSEGIDLLKITNTL